MKTKKIEIAGTVLINDGPDFCATGPCTRWRCKECDYILYGTEQKPPINYCPIVPVKDSTRTPARANQNGGRINDFSRAER